MYNLLRQGFYGLLLIMAVSLPFLQIFPKIPFFSYLIVLLFITWAGQNRLLWQLRQLKRHPLALVVIGFFIWHILSMLWTNDLARGEQDIMTKASLLVLPLIICGGESIPYQVLYWIKRLFITSVIIALAVALIMAASSSDGQLWSLQYYHLSGQINLHPTYLAIFCSLSFFFVLEELQLSNLRWYDYIILLLSLAFLLGGILLCASRGAFIGFLLAALGYIIALSVSGQWRLGVSFSIALLLSFAAVFMFIPGITKRMTNSIDQLQHRETSTSQQGLGARLLIWEDSWQLLQSHKWLGVGVGDVQPELNEVYRQNEHKDIAAKNLNTHNAYFQSWLTGGVICLMLLVSVLAGGILLSLGQREPVIFSFFLIIGTNMLFESMFQIQVGAIFISLFVALFLNWLYYKKGLSRAL